MFTLAYSLFYAIAVGLSLGWLIHSIRSARANRPQAKTAVARLAVALGSFRFHAAESAFFAQNAKP